jgi:hypothetical protein
MNLDQMTHGMCLPNFPFLPSVSAFDVKMRERTQQFFIEPMESMARRATVIYQTK